MILPSFSKTRDRVPLRVSAELRHELDLFDSRCQRGDPLQPCVLRGKREIRSLQTNTTIGSHRRQSRLREGQNLTTWCLIMDRWWEGV